MENNTNKIIELRDIKSKDMFPMFKIISKIGINEFRKCFESDEIKKMIKEDSKTANSALAIAIMLEVGNVIMTNIGSAEEDIYQFISNLSGLKKDEISDLSLSQFTEIIIDIVRKPDFMDFIGVVSKLFK